MMGRQASVSFVFTQLDFAETYLHLALRLRRAEDRRRNIASAWRVYRAVVAYASRLHLQHYEYVVTLERLRALRVRLAETELSELKAGRQDTVSVDALPCL